MMLEGTVPCADGYVLRSFLCTNCGETFKMVEARNAHSAAIAERRAVQRLPVTALGMIAFSGRRLSCTIGNISAVGAGLNSLGSARIPGHFALTTGGAHLTCQLIWRGARRLGIAFT